MRRWSLDQLTVVGVRPVELVEIAARAGYDAVSPFVGLDNSSGLFTVPLRAGHPETVGMIRALRDNGVRLNQVDGFAIGEKFDMEGARRAIELVAEIGANNIVALLFDSDESRGFDTLAALCEEAASADMSVAIEFTALSKLPSLASTVQLIKKLGRSRVGILVDLLHLAQAGESPADLAKVPHGLIRGAQLCDARTGLDAQTYFHVAIKERMAPGTGELPVREFLAALPTDITVGVEVPMIEPRDWQTRASMLLDCARRVDS